MIPTSPSRPEMDLDGLILLIHRELDIAQEAGLLSFSMHKNTGYEILHQLYLIKDIQAAVPEAPE